MTPLRKSVSFQNGVARLDPPPGGFVYTCSISLPDGLPEETYSVRINQVNYGTQNAAGVFGPFQLYDTDVLEVTQTGTATILSVFGQIDAYGHQPSGIVPNTVNPPMVVAGSVVIGNTPSVSISGTPSVKIASGTVDIGAGNSINIASQSVTISTDTPPQLGQTFPASSGGSTITYSDNPPANCSAIGLSVTRGAISGNSNATYYSVTLTDTISGEVLAQAEQIPAANGIILLAPMNPLMSNNGIEITITLGPTGTFSTNNDIMQDFYYLGTTAAFVTNNINQPLFAIGPQASALIGAGGALVTVDQTVVGQWAAQFTDGGAATPAHPDMVVMGNQGATGQSLQTTPEVVYTSNGLPTGGAVSLPANAATYIGNGGYPTGNVRRAWLRLHSASGLITSAWEVGITNRALADAAGSAFYPGLPALGVGPITNGGEDCIAGPFVIPPGPSNSIAWTINPGATAFDSDLYCVGMYEYETGEEYPPQNVASINVSVAAGATTQIVGGTTGQSVRLRKLNLQMSAPTETALQTTQPLTLLTVGGQPGEVDFEGLAAPTGDGIQLKNLGTSTVTYYGNLTFDLY